MIPFAYVGIDLARMVVREPRLLSAHPRELARRLIDMQIAATTAGENSNQSIICEQKTKT
jgi:hypothetical protein